MSDKSILDNISGVPVELWDVKDIKPYEFNNKKHPDKHIEMLMRSIKAHGHLDPIVIDGAGVIISGHGRFEALKRLGRVKVAVRVLRDISDAEASALRIAANKTVSNDYDTDALSRELASLGDLGMDLGALGFDDKELSMLIADVGEMDADTLVIDMTGAVEEHERDIADRAEEADDEEVRLDKVFGFKTISLKDQKYISRWMAEIESDTGLTGRDALLAHVKEALG